MPIYYDLSDVPGRAPSIDVPAPLSQTLPAAARQAYDDSAVGAISRISGSAVNSGGEIYDAPRAREEAAAANVQLDIPETGISKTQLDLLITRQKQRTARQAILDRAPTTFGTQTALRLAEIVGGAPDIALFALGGGGVVAPAWAARVAAKETSSFAARSVARVAAGAVEGAVGTAAIQPLVAVANAYDQIDYDMNDALLNTAFGGLVGGVLHAAGGGIADAAGLSQFAKNKKSALLKPDLPRADVNSSFFDSSPAQKAAAADSVLFSMKNDLPIDVSAHIPDLYKHVDAPDSLAARFDDDTLNAIRDNKGVPRNLQRPVGIVDFIRQNGGINDQSVTFRGEIRNVLGDKGKSRPGLINNKAGASLDELALLAQDAGFFPEKPLFELGQVTPDELVDAIRKELNGQRVYRPDDPRAKPYEDAQAYSAALDDLERVLGENGIDTKLSNEDIRQALRQRDLEAIDKLDQGDFPESYADFWDEFKEAGLVGDDLPATPDEFYKAKASYDAFMKGKMPPAENYSPEYLAEREQQAKTTGDLRDTEDKAAIAEEQFNASLEKLDISEEAKIEMKDLLKEINKEKIGAEKTIGAVAAYTRCILGGLV